MKFKSEEPSHRTFSTFGKTLNDFMNQYPLSAADTQGSWIDKTDTRAGAQQDFSDENGQRK